MPLNNEYSVDKAICSATRGKDAGADNEKITKYIQIFMYLNY